MIFAAVGTQKFPMDRLLAELDRLAGSGALDEPVFMQTGVSTSEFRHCRSNSFLDKAEMAAKVAESSLVICHAGVGSILMALQAGKKVIVVPRRAMFAEHVDDHQVEIARSFARAGYVRIVENITDLLDAIRACAQWQPKQFKSNKDRFNALILSLVNEN